VAREACLDGGLRSKGQLGTGSALPKLPVKIPSFEDTAPPTNDRISRIERQPISVNSLNSRLSNILALSLQQSTLLKRSALLVK